MGSKAAVWGKLEIKHSKVACMKTVSLETLGCKLNQYDTELLAESFSRSPDYTVVEADTGADVRIINTCTVTAKTDRQSRNLVRRATRGEPKPLVVVTGCFAQVNPQAVMSIPGVDYVVPNARRRTEFERIFNVKVSKSIRNFRNHTRAFIKIQEGCSNSCSYCIVSAARGLDNARPSASIVEEVVVLTANGYKEVVLTGTDLGRYRDGDGVDLPELLRKIEETEGLRRMRLSSIHPDKVSESLLEMYASSAKLCPHIHLSIQSGDDRILSLMKRDYTRRDCEVVMDSLVEACPEIAIGADVIAGFPGEDEKAFQNTLDLVVQSPLAYLHVFPFSPRQRTNAAGMNGQVNPELKRRRAATLRSCGGDIRASYRDRFIGEELECLVESKRREGNLVGLTGNYIRVLFQGGDALKNEFVRIRLLRSDGQWTYGTLCQDSCRSTGCG